MKNNKNQNDASGSFVGHLTELRSRLIKSFIVLILIFLACYFFSEDIYRFLVQPYSDVVISSELDRRLIFTALHEAFLTYLKVAFFAALFISSPIFLTQIWKFIAPGLYRNEKRALLPYLIATPILFILGGCLVYYLIMPLAIKFFLSFETIAEPGSIPIQLEAKVNEYLSLVMRLIFAIAAILTPPDPITQIGLALPLLLLYELSIFTVKFIEKK